MKRNNTLALCLVLGLFFSNFSFSQSAYEAPVPAKELRIGKFKVKKIDFSLGSESDYINDMDYNFFVDQIPAAQQARLSDLGFTPTELHSGVCENPSFNLGMTLVHPQYEKLEWRSAFAYKPNRVDAVSYYYYKEGVDDAYLNVHATHAEFTLESALLYKLPLLSFLNLYGGIGTNIGVTSSNTTCVFTSLDLTATDISYSNVSEVSDGVPAGQYGSGDGYRNCFDTGSQLNQRLFLQLGMGIKFFQRIEVGIDIKYGYGYRADVGTTIDRTNIVATNLNLRYILP